MAGCAAAGRNSIPRVGPLSLARASYQNTGQETQVFKETRCLPSGTQLLSSRGKSKPSVTRPRNLCPISLPFVPAPLGLRGERGSGAHGPHSASCPEDPAALLGDGGLRREGRIGEVPGGPTVCPDSRFVPWDLTERLLRYGNSHRPRATRRGRHRAKLTLCRNDLCPPLHLSICLTPLLGNVSWLSRKMKSMFVEML